MEKRTKPIVEETPLPGVRIIRPKLFPDDRGYFCEGYNDLEWSKELGFREEFHQDSISWSKYGVVRGLHTQPDMGKLVTCLQGEIYDVAVDARPGSPNFGKHFGIRLKGEERVCLWIPPGFLHGLAVRSQEGACVYYKCTAVHNSATEFGINPFDPEIGIQWPIAKSDAILSEKDQNAPIFASLKETTV